MTYETHLLGWEPVIRLNTGGLKVGEIARKAKMQGSSDEEAVSKKLSNMVSDKAFKN